MILILADNYRMAGEHARELELGREREGWLYVTEPRQIMGRHPGRFVSITTGHLTPREAGRRLELVAMLEARGFVEGLD